MKPTTDKRFLASVWSKLALSLVAVLGAGPALADSPLCLNDVCIGEALGDVPEDIWVPVLNLKEVSRNPFYLSTRGKPFFDELAKHDADSQAFVLSALTKKFDGSVVRMIRHRVPNGDAEGSCAVGVTLEGEFRDASGRQVLVSASGAQPPGKPPGLYLTRIKKMFASDLDPKRFEGEVRKTWPDALVFERHEEFAGSSPVVVSTYQRSVTLQATRAEQDEWTRAANSSKACAGKQKADEAKYRIN